jgi:hypothetical protein
LRRLLRGVRRQSKKQLGLSFELLRAGRECGIKSGAGILIEAIA